MRKVYIALATIGLGMATACAAQEDLEARSFYVAADVDAHSKVTHAVALDSPVKVLATRASGR